ncbi:aminotransferase class IV [Miltoncostaea marina]|uniref:aminotransferase class IV n=1 Tax=Miltoncostaea marina TaxID=2843215 RepID=UPI001C3CA2C6|nr:aminotransferase class IV [Miltoncostaea marina]
MLRSSSRGPGSLAGHSHTPVVWLDGALVDPAAAALPIADPGVRWGEGLFETMRGAGGRVPLLERHLRRMEGSARALGIGPLPGRGTLERAVAEAVAAAGGGDLRVRLRVTALPSVLVEAAPEAPLPEAPGTARAAAVRGAWLPGNRIAEHKTLSYAGHRWSQRRAEAAGADHALLLDDRGRLGEAAVANVVCAVGGALVTAPADGLLPGVARELVMESLPVREAALDEAGWRGADEIVLVSALRGATAVVAVDGAPVGDGRPGPWAARLAALLRAATA